jgi:hypothetical protein
MRKRSLLMVAVAAAVLLAGYSSAQEALQSGPKVGEQVPGPFHPLNVTGPWKGEKHCLYCEHGSNPVAMIFARKVSPGLTKLIKQIDVATEKNKKAQMGSFVVFLNDSEELGEQLQQLAKKEGLKNIVLSIDNPAGPENYQVARQADVTVVLYEDGTVRANHTFRPGQLNDQAVNRVVNDITKIIPKN